MRIHNVHYIVTKACLVAMVLLANGCGDATGPSPSMAGTWDFIGFSDSGVRANTTGTVEFRSDKSFSWEGTVTFPGEPTDSVVVSGVYHQDGNDLTLTIGSEPRTQWRITATADIVVLVAIEPPPANTISLRRR